MTTVILVWVLMTSSGHHSGGSGRTVQYSPPVVDLADCQRMKDAIDTGHSRCVQVRMMIGVQK